MSTAVKSKRKRGVIVIGIIFGVIAVIAVAAAIFISAVTKPADENSDKAVPVGGMITSDTVNYQDESAKGLEKNPVIKIMQMIWRFCYDGDNKKHADQTPPEVDEWKDIAYIDDSNRYHLLDVYTKKGNTEKLPVIIDIHGGGWMYGDKNLNEYYCKALADRGFTVFNVSYRLVPDVTVNEQIQDVAQALKWIKDNMKDYPCDENSIMITGDSAGGQLALYSSIIMQSSELREIFGTVDVDMDVDALVLTSPVPNMNTKGGLSIYTKLLWGKDYKDKATYNFMNLEEIIDYADVPPTYLITSNADSLAHSQTLQTAQLLEDKGVTVVLKDYNENNYENANLPHVFSVLFPFDEVGVEAIDGASEFYKNIINE